MEIIADGWILQIFSDTIVCIYIGGFACEHPAWIVYVALKINLLKTW